MMMKENVGTVTEDVFRGVTRLLGARGKYSEVLSLTKFLDVGPICQAAK